MHKTVKILWVHDDFEGPVNGLVQYGDEKLWFNRIETSRQVDTQVAKSSIDSLQQEDLSLKLPPIISSTDIPVPSQPLDLQEEIRTYSLTRLSSDILQIVEDNHVAYCNETGAPFNHGDPIKIRRRQQVAKMDLSKIIPEGQDGIDVKLRSLANVKVFNHKYDPLHICGEFVTTVKETDFANYLVPRRVEIE